MVTETEMQRERALGSESGSESQRKDTARMTRSSGYYVPSRREIDTVILEKRKQLLLDKFVGQNGRSEAAVSLAQSVRIQEAQRRVMDRDEVEEENKNENEKENADGN